MKMCTKPSNKWPLLFLLTAALSITLQPLAVTAGAIQSHQSIRDAARQHILANIAAYPDTPQVEVGRLDSRLRLEQCSQSLKTFSPPNVTRSARMTVGVRCDGEKPWSLYVPAQISVMLPIVVAAQDLPRGTLLTRQHLTLEDKDIASLHRGYLEETIEAVGKRLKRPLHRGQVVTPKQLVTPVAVKKGSRVTIIASKGAVNIRMQGQALKNGATGDRIQVRNLSSKREIEATVISPGVVQVTL